MEIKRTGKLEEVINDIIKLDKDEVYDFHIVKHREKRSLNANAYLWALIVQIANVTRQNKEAVYLEELRRYGESVVISVLEGVSLANRGLYFDEFGEGEVNGKKFKHYKIYTHSSEMDSKQFSILLDGVVEDAKELGIETLDDYQIKQLKERT